MSAMSAGVMPVQVALTGFVGAPRSKITGPLTPGAPRWMCITVALTTLCTQVIEKVDAQWLSVPMHPPHAVLFVGGTSWLPRRSKTNVCAAAEKAVTSRTAMAETSVRFTVVGLLDFRRAGTDEVAITTHSGGSLFALISSSKERFMPEKKTIERARRDKRQGKAPSTQAGEFVREEIEHIREGKHGARSTKQAIAIGLSKARRSGVKLPAPKEGEASAETRRSAK